MKDERSVPDWLLERLARGELPAAEAERLRTSLAAEGPSGLARLEALDQSNREILAAHPAAAVAAEVHRRAQISGAREPKKTPWRLTFALPTLALGAAAMAAFLLARPGPHVTPANIDGDMNAEHIIPEHVTSKGLLPRIAVYRKRDGSGTPPERLGDSSAVRAGDTLQVSYIAAGRRYGVVASVDARGAVTLHLPEAPGAAPALIAHGETALPHAYELDETPGFERFVFVTSDHPFATETVVETLRKGSAAALPVGLSLVDLTLHKETP